MYHHICGELFELSPTSAVVVAGGVGFDLRIPMSTYERLKGKKDAFLFTHLHAREEELRLFGFASSAERELFRLLLSVNGVGPAIALASLCALSPEEVARAISLEDLKSLQRIKGVGKKLAERMVLELRDRVGKLAATLGAAGPQDPTGARAEARGANAERTPEMVDAISALVHLGFERKVAEERVDSSVETLKEALGEADRLSVEQIIKESFRSSKKH